MALQEPVTHQILAFAQKTYGTQPEYLWARLPDAAVLRRADNQKWYAVLMPVARAKLGLSGEGTIEIIDLKSDPLLIDALRTRPGYLPAYHMNKLHWFTALLDGSVPAEELCELLRLSYDSAGTGGKA